MGTPDETKRALACYGGEMGCIDDCDVCALNTEYTDWHDVMNDARAYIQQLEGQVVAINKTLEQVTQERDAAISDLRDVIEAADGVNYCQYCKHNEEDGQCHHPCNPYGGESGWEWRGVPHEDAEHGKS